MQGLRVFRELETFFEYVIKDRLNPGRQNKHGDIINVLLKLKEEQAELGETEFIENNIKGAVLKVQDEVRNHIGNKGKVTETDLDKLEYLKMVIKETLRRCPAAPLLVARETLSRCQINGYDVDPKTIIQVNVWAIERDPKYWKEPEKFYPERFVDSSIDYKGQNFEFLPFGAGRRMCPGLHVATITTENAFANLFYWFDWKLPEGMTKEGMNMEEKAGFSLTITKKMPLILVPVKHLQ